MNAIAIPILIVYIRYPKTLILIKAMLLKEILKSRGLKQKWLAEKLGVSEVAVSNWCSGKSVPSANNLARISQILKVSKKSISNT